MKWQRVITFEIEADNEDEALEIWEDDGPECGPGVKANLAYPLYRANTLQVTIGVLD